MARDFAGRWRWRIMNFVVSMKSASGDGPESVVRAGELAAAVIGGAGESIS